MHFIITGASGFIGSHLTESVLAAGHSVSALCRYRSDGHARWLEPLRSHPRLDIQLGDITDTVWLHKMADRALQQMTANFVLVNCAAMVSVPKGEELWNLYQQVNTLALDKLQSIFNFAKILHISTSEVFSGRQSFYAPDAKPDPVTRYGHCKAEAEKLVLGSDNTVLRLFNTFGPRQTPRAVIARMCREMARWQHARDNTPKFGDPMAVRTFIPVVATVGAIYRLATGRDAPGLYQFAHGTVRCIEDVWNDLCEIAYGYDYDTGAALSVEPEWNLPQFDRGAQRVPCLKGGTSPEFDTIGAQPEAGYKLMLAATYAWWEQSRSAWSEVFGAGEYQ